MSTIPPSGPGPYPPPGGGSGPTLPDLGPSATEPSIAGDFPGLRNGSEHAKNVIVVDKENASLSLSPNTDPIRRDSLAHWATFEESGLPNQTLAWIRDGRHDSLVESARINNIEYRTSTDDGVPSELFPYGVREETIRITYKDNFLGDDPEAFLSYLLANGFANVGREYFDHALEYFEAFTPEQNQALYGDTSGMSHQLTSQVAFDYNFYTKLYEENVGRYTIPETIYPHIYTFYLEKERALEGGDSPFYGDIVDASYLDPRIDQEGYSEQWIYHDFITLNRPIEEQRIFINLIRETSVSSEKIGEIDRGEYFDVWADRYPNALAGSVETAAGSTLIRIGIDKLTDKYKNVIIPLTTEDRIHSSYNSYKELFPMFADIQFSQTSPNKVVQSLTDTPDDDANFSIFNNLMRDVISDFIALSRVGGINVFSTVKNFAENHEQAYPDSLGNPSLLPTAGNATRRVFNLGDWALGEESIDYNESDYIFLQNFASEEAETTLSDLITIRRNSDVLVEDFVLADILPNLRNTLLNAYNNHRRTYRDILSGNRAYSEDVFFKVSKFAISPSGVRSSTPIQSFYLVNDEHNRSVVNLIDTQLKYGETYEYEINTCRLVYGTKTRITSARYFRPDSFRIRTDGEPGFMVSGVFRPVVAGEVSFIDEATTPTTPPIGPGGGPGSGGTPPISFEPLPAEFYSSGGQINLVDVDIQLVPSIQLIELPYVSSITAGINVLRRTMLDDPPMPPEVEVLPYTGVNDHLLFLLNTGAGSREFLPISFNSEEQNFIDRIRLNNPGSDTDEILYENDDPSTIFEVYRLERKPTSYNDFKGNLLAEVNSIDELIGYRQASSVGYRNFIQPNTVYYYMFRAVDIHGHVSHPSPVYQIELIDDQGAVYPIIRSFEFESQLQRKSKIKKLNRFLKISPTFLQSVLGDLSITSGPPATAPREDSLPLGVQTLSLWDKSFKIRLTGRKTGRKIDLNINFNKEYDNTLPDEAPDIVYDEATSPAEPVTTTPESIYTPPDVPTETDPPSSGLPARANQVCFLGGQSFLVRPNLNKLLLQGVTLKRPAEVSPAPRWIATQPSLSGWHRRLLNHTDKDHNCYKVLFKRKTGKMIRKSLIIFMMRN